MPGLMPDHDVEGQWSVLLGHLNSPIWQEDWQLLAIDVFSFRMFGLAESASDRLVWQTCQQHQVMLITGNRNDDGPDSLTATLRDANTLESWPVFTLADTDRIMQSSSYAEQVVVRLIGALMYLDNIRGAGRIWLP